MSRYIDLENWEDFTNTIYNQCDTDATWDRANNIVDGLCMLATNDVEPIIHAHWIHIKGITPCCSNCGCCIEEKYIEYKRCPMCGRI